MSVDFTINCWVCDSELDLNGENCNRSGDWSLQIDPCEECLKEAKAKGIEEGKKLQT